MPPGNNSVHFMGSKTNNHIIVVDAYEGHIEFLTDEPEEQKSMQGIGLPLDEIAELLDCRISVLCWDEWYGYETKETWVPVPATRPLSPPDFNDQKSAFRSERVKRVPIPPKDPEYLKHFDEAGLSPRSYGLINDSGLLFFASYCLNKELGLLYEEDPFQTVILPMLGGIGYVAQMARATGSPNGIDVPFAVVVTDVSANRQEHNQEGMWTRHATVRRQMEDVSLALADLTLVYGPRGAEIANAGRLPEAHPPLYAPRLVDDSLLSRIAHAGERSDYAGGPVSFFLYEPQAAASGVLSALDATNLLVERGTNLERPVISAGPDMTFAPMKPRGFVSYWSSRGFVRELVGAGKWEWASQYAQPGGSFAVRLYPSYFEHLPNIWAELARRSFVLLSPAAAEGLAPGEALPEDALIDGVPTPERLASCIERILGKDVEELERIRGRLCGCVVEAHLGKQRQLMLNEAVEALSNLLRTPPDPQDLSRVAVQFLDRRSSLRALAEIYEAPELPVMKPGAVRGTLSVVVNCYQMGHMIKEAVESVWASRRRPDEVLLIDDGSQDYETSAYIAELEKVAAAGDLPLTVIRHRNRGLAASRNVGLERAGGEFISFLDGDDMVEPLFYHTGLRILEKYPRLGGVAAWAFCFGADVPDGFWNAPQTELPFLFIENSVVVPCITRTELLRRLGGYDTRQRYNYEDWELSIRMLASGWPIVTIPMNLVKYRIRQDSLYRTMTDVQNQVMRELLFGTHREVASRFANEIILQLEHQLMASQSTAGRPGPNGPLASRPLKKLWWATQRFLNRLSTS
jgi:hypothetical protein